MTKVRWIVVSRISAVVVSCLAMGLVVGGCTDASDADDGIGWKDASVDAHRDAKADARSGFDQDDSSARGVDVVSDVVAEGGADSLPDPVPDADISAPDTSAPDVEVDVPPDVAPDVGEDPAVAQAARQEIIDAAGSSSCAAYSWKNRGRAPAAYIKGVSLVFARAVCNQSRADVVYVSQAQPSDKGSDDALKHYNGIFEGLGMSNNADGVDTLRHAYTLLLGLGMRESSGKHCEGRDMSASNTSADTAEAGAWQTSYNSNYFNKPLLLPMFDKYKADTSGCLLDVFSEGVTCSSANWSNYGSGNGRDFQDLSKKCPAFAAEWAAVMLRSCHRHYGPLQRKEAEVKPECDSMFKQVQDIITKTPSVCKLL